MTSPDDLSNDVSLDLSQLYRRVRDEIRAFVETLPTSLPD
jgi:hypothetical protein